jgi:hypothetical protein
VADRPPDPLKDALARLRRPAGPPPTPLQLGPTTAFEVAVDQRLRNLEARVEEVKGRINGLIFLLVGAVLLELVMRLVK